MCLDASLNTLTRGVRALQIAVYSWLDSICVHTCRWLGRQAQVLSTLAMASFQRTQPLQISVRKLV